MNRIGRCTFGVTALLAALIAETNAQVSPSSTQSLYQKCKSADSAQQEVCASYLMGSAEVMAMLGKTFAEPPQGIEKETVAAYGLVGICSATVNGAVLRQVFLNWAEKHPLHWKLGMSQGVMMAFQETWPCPPS